MHDHHHHPAAVVPASAGPSLVRTSELLGALSTALDLTEGLLAGHSARTCWLSIRLADRIGLGDEARESLFYAALLKDAGCSSNAAALTSIFGGDERALKAMQATSGRSMAANAVLSVRALSAREPLPTRIRRLVHLAVSGSQERRAMEQTRCERGARIAGKLGFGPEVSEAVMCVHEHWDGGGLPQKLAGEAIPLFSRIITVCAALDVLTSAYGARRAVQMVKRRGGTWYDPQLTAELVSLAADGLMHELTGGNVEGRIGEMEPDRLIRLSDDADIDRIASAFADVIDAKSPYTASHSRGVAELADGLARHFRLPDTDIRDVRRAGLLHDIGKLGIPNSILDKPGRLTADEYMRIREHPELSLRILQPVAIFARVSELAASHHERLDGTGYFRGLNADALSLGARIVAVSDVYEALTADRPYREAWSPERALEVMRQTAGDHLASDVIDGIGHLA